MGKIDLTGKRFARLLVIKFNHKDKKYTTYWLCQCDCGTVRVVQGRNLISGHTRSCGCLQKEIINTHGMTDTPTYNSWVHMKARCLNPKDRAYNYYGGRGIKVCDRWLSSFENFLEDMGIKPDGLTIERINNNDDYTPENCKWATRKEQMNNRRINHILQHDDISLNITQWAEKLNISRKTLWNRINRGWPVARALTELVG